MAVDIGKYGDKLTNRAQNGRPRHGGECRNGFVQLQKLCKEHGHEFEFHRYDNYGCCKRCGAEVLT